MRINNKISNIELVRLEKGIDVVRELKYRFSKQISDKVLKKIEITSVSNFSNASTEYETSFIVFTKKEELFDLLYSFNKLSEEEKERYLKYFSSSEEFYLNKVREDRLYTILEEEKNTPFPNNI